MCIRDRFIDGAVVANEFSTCLTVEFKLLTFVQGAIQGHLFQRIYLLHFALQLLKRYDFMLSKLIPITMDSCAHRTYKVPTVTTIAGRWTILVTFVALYLTWFFHLLKGILNLKEVVDVERRLEVRDVSGWGKEGGLSAGGAA